MARAGAAGNVTTEDAVLLRQEIGVETGVDLDAMKEADQLAERVVGHPQPGKPPPDYLPDGVGVRLTGGSAGFRSSAC